MDFSTELIEKTKTYFAKRLVHDLSDDEVGRALEQLGKLGLIAAQILSEDPVPSVLAGPSMGGGGPMAAPEALGNTVTVLLCAAAEGAA